MESLEGRTMLTAVVGLTLMNADTGAPLMTIAPGTVVNLSNLPTRRLNVQAITSGYVQSVRFGLDSIGNYRVDSYAPYALAGDTNGVYSAWTPSVGSHTIYASPYTADYATGTLGQATRVSFTVVDQAAAASAPSALPVMPAPPTWSVNYAKTYPLIRYHREILGGAFTNLPAGGGAPITLAAAAFSGNSSADARLLQQIRYTLTGGNDIIANGGYVSQHERHVTSMFAVVRRTSRIWYAMSATEQKKADLLMMASLVASAFTTGDSNPYLMSGEHQRSLDGLTNIGRDWNPNYREGMIGAMLVAMVYFGGPAKAIYALGTYNHADFVAQLKQYGLTNIHQTFNWKAANPASDAPSGTQIEQAVRRYSYYGLSLNDYMQIYWKLTSSTYGKNITAGLNNGYGINGAGKIVTGAAGLLAKGAMGMLSEFDTLDANGPRSSATYAYDSYRTHQMTHYALVAGGWWRAGTPEATNSLARMKIGSNDLWYKLDKGYINYAKGKSEGTVYAAYRDRGFEFTRPIWESILKVYHKVG